MKRHGKDDPGSPEGCLVMVLLCFVITLMCMFGTPVPVVVGTGVLFIAAGAYLAHVRRR